MKIMDDEFQETIANMNVRVESKEDDGAISDLSSREEPSEETPRETPRDTPRETNSLTSGREHAIHEILQTETVYVNDLRIAVNFYLKPLRRKKLLTEENINGIFSNMETLLHINETLLRDLEECCGINPDGSTTVTQEDLQKREDLEKGIAAIFINLVFQSFFLSSIRSLFLFINFDFLVFFHLNFFFFFFIFFKKKADFLKSYRPYCSNYGNAVQLLGKLCKENENLSVFFEVCHLFNFSNFIKLI
jgi:hypothetical protein